MADTFTSVDLSALPAPSVVETLDVEAVVADLLAELRAEVPDYTATVESDPAMKLLRIAAYRIVLLRARVNDAARAVMVAYARGADLDNLAALFGVTRLVITPADAQVGTAAVTELDADLRRRILLAPGSYSVAGPEDAYIFHALSADAGVKDASAISPDDQPGVVIVTILDRDGDGTALPALIATVATYLSAKTRRPLTDNVVVQSAAIQPFAIVAAITLYSGPDSAIVLAQARAQLDAYLAESLRLGRDITRFGILAALACAGIQNIDLQSPAADIVCDRTQAGHCTAITLTDAGVGE